MDRRSLLRRLGALGGLGAVPSAAMAQTAANSADSPSNATQTGLNVTDFGATGDGKADDTKAIQDAIDFALVNRRPLVYLPPGHYRTTDTLHLGYGFDFATVALTGDATYSYAGKTAGATLLPDAIDRPAINVQGGRGNVIRALSIVGKNADFIRTKIATPAGMTDADPQGWLSPDIGPQGLRKFAPYAAITIDAFSGPAPADGYAAAPVPAFADVRLAAHGRLFSSDVIIDRCWIGGFGVGVAVQPCDADGNGDFTKIIASSIGFCVYGVAVGNGQSRNVAIRDCTYVGVHTFLTNRHFGRGVGTLGGPIDNLSGGASYQLMDVGANAASPLTISHLYFEAQARIGTWSLNAGFNQPLIFQSCAFHLGEGYLGASTGALLDCGPQGSVRFVGCTFSSAHRIVHPVRGADFVSLDGCVFGHLEDFRSRDQYRITPDPIKRALAYTCGGVFLNAPNGPGEHTLLNGTGLFIDAQGHATSGPYGHRIAPLPGERALVHHYAREVMDRSGRIWRILGARKAALLRKQGPSGPVKAFEYVAADQLELVCDATLEAALGRPVGAGDILYDANSATVLVVGTVTVEAALRRIQATQLNNLRIDKAGVATALPVPADTGYLWHYATGVFASDTVFFGDFQKGEATVTNVHDGDGHAVGLAKALFKGDALHGMRAGPPLPGSDQAVPYERGTLIAAVDEALRTVTLDRPATASARAVLSMVALA